MMGFLTEMVGLMAAGLALFSVFVEIKKHSEKKGFTPLCFQRLSSGVCIENFVEAR